MYELLTTDRFVSFYQNFSVLLEHVGRSKPGSKPILFYVSLSLRPLGQQAYHSVQGNF